MAEDTPTIEPSEDLHIEIHKVKPVRSWCKVEVKRLAISLAVLALTVGSRGAKAQTEIVAGMAPDHPTVTVAGISYTPNSILRRNMGTPLEQLEQFPPHHIIGSVY
jgi:glutamate synthase domain-containing protein 2